MLLTVDLERLDLGPGDLLLDAGCGEGRHCFGALERGANIALDKNFVIFVRTDQNLDVTSEVLARLNKEIPDVTVEVAAE